MARPKKKPAARSVLADGWHAKFICLTLLHEPYHGLHHWRSCLPQHVDALEPTVPEERPPFRAALHDVFINLPDPRVGAQWPGVTRTTRQEMASRD